MCISNAPLPRMGEKRFPCLQDDEDLNDSDDEHLTDDEHHELQKLSRSVNAEGEEEEEVKGIL